MDQKQIGSFLKELRKEKNLTQEQLAEKLNVSGRTVSRWETGANMPDISLLVEISEIYEVSIPEIINGERKSENMNEEIKETAEKMADYAKVEKETIIRNIRNESIMGTVALVVLALIETIGMKSFKMAEYIAFYCRTLTAVTVLMIFMHSTGLLYKFKRKNRLENMPAIVRYIIAAVAAYAMAYLIGKIF